MWKMSQEISHPLSDEEGVEHTCFAPLSILGSEGCTMLEYAGLLVYFAVILQRHLRCIRKTLIRAMTNALWQRAFN